MFILKIPNNEGTNATHACLIYECIFFGIILFIIVTYTFNIITYIIQINTMYPALTDLLVTFRYTHIKIEELYNNSQNLNAIYIYTYSNDFLFSHSELTYRNVIFQHLCDIIFLSLSSSFISLKFLNNLAHSS